MSTDTQPIQVPPSHAIPNSAIDALFGRGLDRDGWKTELERHNYSWVPSLMNRTIKREFRFFKAEIGRLLSAPNTNQRRRSKSNSRRSILKQMKGKTGERAARLSNRTLFSPDAKLRTFEHYVKQWQKEDPSYGVPASPPTVAVDTDTEEDNPAPSNYQARPSSQPQPVDHGNISDANHDYCPSFDQRAASSAAKHLQPVIFDHDTSGDARPPNFEEPSLDSIATQTPRPMGEYPQEQPALEDLLSSHFNPAHGNYQSDFEVPEWDTLEALMMSTSASGYALGDSDLNEIYEFLPVTPFEQSRLSQISSQGIFVTCEPGIDTPMVQHPSQENPDEAIFRAALIRELSTATLPRANASSSLQQQSNNVAPNSQNVVAISSVGTSSYEDPEKNQANALPYDTEMLDINYSYFSDNDDETDELQYVVLQASRRFNFRAQY